MLRTIFLGLLLGTLAVSAQTPQCPDTFPEECCCSEYYYGPQIYCVTIAMDTWDIQATFDAVADAFNSTNKHVNMIEINSAFVTSPAEEVPAYSVSTLKTEYLYLRMDRYKRIDPDAFYGTHNTTLYLSIYDMDFQNTGEAFDLFNNFQVLRELRIDSGSTLTQIPAYAFHHNLRSLYRVYILNAALNSIGDLAFAALPDLTILLLDNNKLTLANISDTAFTFSKTGITLSLQVNPGITYLPEEKFGNFLRGNQNILEVGCRFCNPKHVLHCDDRIDWICDEGVARINGYYCLEAGYDDIYDYCEQKLGNRTHYRQNFEDAKKMQIADSLRNETLKREEEFRRHSFATRKGKLQNQIHM